VLGVETVEQGIEFPPDSSPGRMRVSAYRPYLRPLRLTAGAAFGASTGPCFFWAFKRVSLDLLLRCHMAHLRRDDCWLELEPTCGPRVTGVPRNSFRV